MKTTGLESYSFYEKNKWRRWVWNSIKRNLSNIKSKKAIGLYLPGPDANDLKIFSEKGFRKYNLIGVDNNLENIKKLREKGFIGIHGKLQDIIDCWGGHPKFDFINADLCCGITEQFYEVLISIFKSISVKEGAVVAFNLLRGRDLVTETHDTPDFTKKSFYNVFPETKIGDPFRHRGFILAQMLYKNSLTEIPDLKLSEFLHLLKFKFYSYKSGINVMDSVVFNVPPIDKGEPNKDINKKIKQRVAAAKAIRTMRLAA